MDDSDLPYKAWGRTSPSQIDTFRRCQRKWWWEKVRGQRSPETEATSQGTLIHAQLEKAVLDGTPPENPTALAILEHVGYGLLPRDCLEREFELTIPGWAVPIKGVIDRIEKPGSVVDYKTTSSISRYAKTEDYLRTDTQALIYSWVGIHVLGMNDPLTFSLVYGERRKGLVHAKTSRRTVVFSAEDLEPHMAMLGEITHDQQRLAQIREPGDVPANTDACNDYGGCPHRRLCAKYLPTPSWVRVGGKNKRGETKMSDKPQNPLLLRMRANKKRQAEAVSSPSSSSSPTGRLSSSEPAIQNAPVRTEEARTIRDAFARKPNSPGADQPPPPVEPSAFNVGDTVRVKATGQTDRIVEEGLADGVWCLMSGIMVYEREIELVSESTPTAAKERVQHDPLRDGINPPDGVPDDEEVSIPDTGGRGARVPENMPHEGELFSKLKKAEAAEVRSAMMQRLGLSDPWGAAGNGKPSAQEIKDDLKTLLSELEKRGPWDAPNNTDSAPPAPGGVSSPSSPSPGTGGAPSPNESCSWQRGRPLLLVGCVALGGKAALLADVIEPYVRKVEEQEGMHIGLVSHYGVTGYHKAAALLHEDLEQGTMTLPPLIHLPSAQDAGAKELVAVLIRHCAVVGRS